MASAFPRAKFGEVTVNHDARRVPVREADRRPGPYPYYGASGVVDHVDGYLFDGLYLLIAEDGENLRTRQTPVAFLASGRFWVNNHAHIVTGNERADTRYLCYAAAATDISGYLTGSAMPKLSQRAMNAIEVPLPSLDEQLAIAGVLGALDDKIEQNRRTSAALERLARAMFRAWFVDFEPVKAKAAGATSFPSMPQDAFDALPARLVDCDFGPLPEWWAFQPVSEAFEVNPARRLAKGQVAPYLDMKNMPTQGHAPETWEQRPHGSGMRFINGDTLVARITPCLENGKTAFVDFLNDGEVAWGSTEYIVLRPKPPLPDVFAYCLARTAEFREFAIQNMSGTSGRQRVAASGMEHFQIAVPDAVVARGFGEITDPMFRLVRAAMDESRKLAQVRDYLLPKLLSGVVRVREAERAVMEAV
jgi:type I restriction enzyme S subunit